MIDESPEDDALGSALGAVIMIALSKGMLKSRVQSWVTAALDSWDIPEG